MKKYFLLLLFFCLRLAANAQNISFFDLTNLTNLSDGEAHNYLTLGGNFKQLYIQEIDGNKIEHFKTLNPKVAEQTVTVGKNIKLANGTILRTVSYTTRDPQHVVNMIGQARRSRLIMKFQGMDATNNIYVFDNEFYHVSMYISTTENTASVEVKQKEFVGY
ncbi:hypothetical protein FFF34_017710 [Inquilinus sp. KBS0705]|nr:hypothetical protein FFF34_017710 [Inquilinus sp. KBS0705]